MRTLVWDSSLVTGHEAIDSQHEKLVGLINRLAAAWDSPEREGAVMQAITEMYLYANEHFREEEALMASVGYPQMEAHRGMHQAFVAQAHAFTDASLADHVPFDEMLGFLTGWLANHIGVPETLLIEAAICLVGVLGGIRYYVIHRQQIPAEQRVRLLGASGGK